MKLTIYKCDICQNESDPDEMLHTEDDKDICVGCLERLVNKHFAKMEAILESAGAKEPLPSKEAHPVNAMQLNGQEEVDAIKVDYANGMSKLNIAKKYHRGLKFVSDIVGKNEGTTGRPKKSSVGKADDHKRLQIDWGKAQALRDAGWTLGKIADELGVCADSVFNHTHKPEKKATKPNEWTGNALAQLAGTDQEEMEELMNG